MIRIAITIIVYCFVGYLLCNIDCDKNCTQYSGIWYGLFFVTNFLRSWLGDAIYKVNYYNTAYNFFNFELFKFLDWKRQIKDLICNHYAFQEK